MSKQTFTINHLAISDNMLYGHRAYGKRVVRYMTRRGKEFKINVRHTLRRQKAKKVVGDVSLKIRLMFPDMRKRDVQGHLKALIDAMEGILYDDDSQIVSLYATKKVVSGKPQCIVEVSPNG